MKSNRTRTQALWAAYAICCSAVAPFLRAQTVPPPSATSTDDEQPIQLSPFVVDASADQNGYRANSTLAGTRVRTDLKDVPSAISVVTEQFLKDTGARNNADLLVYTPSTEVAGIRGNFTGVAGTGIFQENTISTSTRVRGLDAADNTRDYFLTDIPWDSFNVGRVDLQRGPNSILFGIGSPAGIINNSVNDAAYKTHYNAENRVDQWGSVRNSIDLNQVLVPGVASVRLAALKDDQKFEQKPAFNNTDRWYLALRLDPKLFSEDNRTTLRFKYEDGNVRSNNPRQLPPVDEITPWFKSGTDANGNLGLNHMTINQYSLNNVGPDGRTYGGRSGGVLSSNTFELGGWAQGRSYWADVINYYEGTSTTANSVPSPNPPGGTPIKTITAQPNTDLGLRDANGNTLGVFNPNFRPMAIPSMSQYAANIGFNSAYPAGHQVPGGAYYADTVLTDPSIFNFYKYLLDGPNKNEWQDWKAFNGALEQSFFNDRLAIQVAYDSQKYDNGTHGWMTGSNYAINVDVNQTYADGTPNPNVGRPYVANAASAPSLNYANKTQRDTFRVTPTFEFRPEDVGLKGAIGDLIGKHNFTGVYDRYNQVNDYVNWAEYATTVDYTLDNYRNDATHIPDLKGLGSGRSFEWLVYVGPNMSNRSTASGANLRPIDFKIAPPQQESTWNFNARWNKPTNPSAAGYVDPTAPFAYTNYQTGATVNGTQVDNPANYIGWSQEQITWMSDTDPNQYPSLVEAAQRTRYRDTSRGIVWQGHMLGGDLVPTFGWRKDVIKNYQTVARTDPITAFTSLDYPDDLSSRRDIRGESKSWGFVYHLSKQLTKYLPADTTVSVFYNKSENFKADAARLNLAGQAIPNATGDTKEYGITVSTFHDKLILKADWYKTKVANATLGVTVGNSIGGLGNNAYFIADGSIWGYAWATSLQDGIRGQTPGTNYWDYATNDGFTTGSAAAQNYNLNGGTAPNGNTYAGANAVVAAWLKAPFPQTFFSSYNLSPPLDPTIGARTGNLRDSFPLGYNDANGPQPGSGSNFGNHQITVDNLSKGVELELTYQPTRNWNITANYSKVNATHENVDAAAQKFIGDMTQFMNGPGGQVREWYNGGQNLGVQWNNSIVAPFAVTMNQQGHEAPEVAPWRFNAVSTYTFSGSEVKWLKGVFVGGALRTEGGRIIGYHFNPSFKNVISDDPRYAAVRGLTLGGLDINQPYRSSAESHVDAWIGYTRKFTHNVDWRIQLNIRSVGEKTRLRAAQINPDGQIALARIVEGMGFELTNSFDF